MEKGKHSMSKFQHTPAGSGESQDRLDLESAREMLRWVAQTVHQGYHTDHPGTWEECPKNICESTKRWFQIHSDENHVAQRLMNET